jgi:GT2 family glycosyltransferase
MPVEDARRCSLPSSGSPAVTVVVCTYQGAETLAACLAALGRQTIAERVQVVVVVDGSNDASAEIAKLHDVEIIVHSKNLGLSAARNTGLAAASAPIVAFTDDDCVPTERWLEELLKPYERPEVGAVGGSVGIARIDTFVHRYLAENNPLAPLELELSTSNSLPYRLYLYGLRMWSLRRPSGSRAVYSFPGANMSFRKELLERVGGFDPEIRFGSDDEYLCSVIRARFPDLVLWYEPAAEVLHDYTGTLRDVWRRNFAYGRGHARVYREDPEQRWPIIFPVPILALLAPVLLRSPRRIVVGLVLLQLLLPQGMLSAARRRRPGNLSFSLLRLIEEGAHDAGMVVGLLESKAKSDVSATAT